MSRDCHFSGKLPARQRIAKSNRVKPKKRKEAKMRKLTLAMAIGLATVLLAGFSGTGGAPTFTGEIMDVPCGLVKTHAMMMQQKGSKTPVDCTQACVRDGGKVVLYDSAHQKVYQLQDQQKA